MTQNLLFISESPHLHHWVTLAWRAPQHSWVCTVDLTCLPTILSPPPTLLSTLVLLLHSDYPLMQTIYQLLPLPRDLVNYNKQLKQVSTFLSLLKLLGSGLR